LKKKKKKKEEEKTGLSYSINDGHGNAFDASKLQSHPCSFWEQEGRRKIEVNRPRKTWNHSESRQSSSLRLGNERERRDKY